MRTFSLNLKERAVLAALALLAVLIPNGLFLYVFFTDYDTVRKALTNPISLVFVVEAFVLMFLFAWLLKKMGINRPTGLMFVVMSLVGSLGFSIPATLWFICRDRFRRDKEVIENATSDKAA